MLTHGVNSSPQNNGYISSSNKKHTNLDQLSLFLQKKKSTNSIRKITEDLFTKNSGSKTKQKLRNDSFIVKNPVQKKKSKYKIVKSKKILSQNLDDKVDEDDNDFNSSVNDDSSISEKNRHEKANSTNLLNPNQAEVYIKPPHKNSMTRYGKITDYIFNVETNLFSGTSYEFTKTVEFLFRKNTMNSLYQFCFSFTSLLAGVVQVELDNDKAYKKYILVSEWICFLCSLGLWFTFLSEYFINCEMKHYIGKLPIKLWRWNPNDIFWLFLTFLVFLPHPNPAFNNIKMDYYNSKYNFHHNIPLNSILFSLCMFRLWFAFKLLIVFSTYSSARTARACEMNKFQVNFSFYLKALMESTPYYVYGLLMIISITFCSYNIRIYERGLDEVSGMNFRNIYHSIWCIIVTMTTVGFGDKYPNSSVGRIIGIFSCFLGVFLISMLVITITNVLNLMPHEKNVWLILERVNAEEKKIEKAKKIICKYIDIIQTNKKEQKKKYQADNEILKKKKYEFLYEFNNYKQASMKLEKTYPPYTEFDQLNDNLHVIDEDFSLLEKDQKNINSKLDKIFEKLGIELVEEEED